jgi:hypothetical protein
MCGNSLRVEDSPQDTRADKKPSRVRQPTTSLTSDEADTLREDAAVTEWQPHGEISATQTDELFGVEDSQTPEVSQSITTIESQEDLMMEESEEGAVESSDEMVSIVESEDLFDVEYAAGGGLSEGSTGGLTDQGDVVGEEAHSDEVKNGEVDDSIASPSDEIEFLSSLNGTDDTSEDTVSNVVPEDDELPFEMVPFEEVPGEAAPFEVDLEDAGEEPSFLESREESLSDHETSSAEKNAGHQDEVAVFVSLEGDDSQSASDGLDQKGEPVTPEDTIDVEESEQERDFDSQELVDDSLGEPHSFAQSISQRIEQEEVREASNTDEKEAGRVAKQPPFEKALKGRGDVGNTGKTGKEMPEVKHKHSESERRGQEGQRKQQAQSPTKSPLNAPRLFGWLVSYGDPEGDAIELREGRVLVTGSSLKKGDLVIDAPSISTPHAMLMMSVENGFFIQDLISERGVWVRKKGEDTYHREDNNVELNHGDWLRLGDIEFVVSLVAYVGVK